MREAVLSRTGHNLNDELVNILMDEKFWKKIDDLVSSAKIVIDRPKGSAHPKYPTFIYPLDYGFLEGTKASDGNEIDVWLGSLTSKRATAILCTIDMLKRDMETKILIGCSAEEEKIIFKCMNESPYMSAILIPR